MDVPNVSLSKYILSISIPLSKSDICASLKAGDSCHFHLFIFAVCRVYFVTFEHWIRLVKQF